MNILLLHPEDAFQESFHDSWSRERWDMIVDLGRAPKSFYEEWSRKLDRPVFSIIDLAVELEDLAVWRELLEPGLGRVVDRYGIDWWNVISILLWPRMQELRLAQRLADEIGKCETITASRKSAIADALQIRLQCRLKILNLGLMSMGLPRRLRDRLGRYKRAATNLSFDQLRQVVYDKYDPGYARRRKFAGKVERSTQPTILIPSAYSNVTRSAFSYARLLPQQEFLLVLARETADSAPVPSNVRAVALASFASDRFEQSELLELENRWQGLSAALESHAECELIARTRLLDTGKRWLRWGLPIRDAWRTVYERQPIVGCLCGDDSNPYTRIPLLLAVQKKMPAVAFHHGALDAMMAVKRPGFSTYLVKGEMERDYLERVCKVDRSYLKTGAASAPATARLWSERAKWIAFFTEPYETDHWRTEALYREVMPRLCAAARRAGKTVLVKLHPFETVRARQRLLKRVLNEADRDLVTVTAAPPSREMYENIWCAVTVESTTACECAIVGIPGFLCGWLRHAYIGYAGQFEHFGVAQMLDEADDLLKIPERLETAMPRPDLADRLLEAITPHQLNEILRPPQAGSLR
jgi:hypothetical protein